MKIKINDLKLAMLFLASFFVLGNAFLAFAENTKNPANLFLDSDQDGISDEEEKTYGTNPNNPDTDGDGYTDGAEIKSGYDPIKPSPGDKIETVSVTEPTEIIPVLGKETNLTQKLNDQLSNKLSLASDPENSSEEATLENLRSVVQEFLTENTVETKIIPLTTDDIKVKKQNYSDLSEEEKKEKMSEDFTDYSISLFYVLSLNSEKPLLSTSDFEKSLSETLNEIAKALLDNDLVYFDKLEGKTQKVLEEIKDVKVPEEFQEIHVKILNALNYGLSLKGSLVRDANDPVLNLVNFSKINTFFESFISLSKEFRVKSNQYELDNNLVKEKLEKMGIDTSWSESELEK